MRVAYMSVVRRMTLGLLPLAVIGCGLVTDVFNQGLASQLGLDPAYVIPARGTVMVAFKNSTSFPVVFSAFKASDAQDHSLGARNFTVPVDTNDVGNEVLQCPVAVVSPGALNAAFAADNSRAAVVQASTGTVTVAYQGQPLFSGATFTCGDVIEVRLSLSATPTSQPSGQSSTSGLLTGGQTAGGQQTTGQTTGQGTQQQAAAQYSLSVRIIPGR